MKRTIIGVALAGVAASIAIAVRSDLRVDPPLQQWPAPVAPAGAPAEPASDAPLLPTAAEPVPASAAPRGTETGSGARPAADPGTPEQSATGPDVLRRASAAYSAVKSLQANFTQKRENPLLSSTVTNHGTLYQKRPDRFLMKFSQPAGDVIVSDGRYFWLYYPSADRKQVLRAPASEQGAGGVDLQAQFLGDPLRRFTHTYHGTEVVNGRSAHVLTLVPRENPGYQSLKVWIDTRDALVRRFVLTENNGVVQEFTLTGLTLNPALSNDLFTFTPPADAHIVERP